LSLAVVKDGEIVWEEAFGLADLERKIPASPSTLYPIASATKPITATAVMILVERGLVDLDKPANTYAFGWESGTRCGYPVVTHGGVMEGCRAHMAMIPSEGPGAAVPINGENVPSIQVCDWIFAALLPEYAGKFKDSPPGGGPPFPPPPFKPTLGIIGTWEGTTQTHQEVIPVRLVVEADGRVELVRLEASGAPGRCATRNSSRS
jgi:hypothetical protein